MKAAILTNALNSFFKPMAEGLGRMLSRQGVEAEVMYDGLDLLDFVYQPRRLQEGPLHFLSANARRYARKQRQASFFKHLMTFDFVVVVANNPYAFIRDRLSGIERIRAMKPQMPIVQYNYSYLPVAGKGGLFQEYFVEGLGSKAFGMERYDHYLMVTDSSPQPLPPAPQPLHLIGLDFDDGSLYPAQEGFRVLLDFPREGKEAEREIVLGALRRTNTPYVALEGSYTIAEIRKVYRGTAAYFVSFLESFGFPICELQACGSLIFSPYHSWLYAHSIKEDPHQPGLGRYTDNFVVYGNDQKTVEDSLMLARQTWDPKVVRDRFLREQGSLFRGDALSLEHFVSQLREGRISGSSHQEHHTLLAGIDPVDHCPPPW